MHLYYDLLLTPEEIAPLILSPRKASGGVGVRAVQDVLDFFEVYHHVENHLRAPRALKMPEAHFVILVEIVKRTPWLYLDEIPAELDSACHVQYLPGYCQAMPRRLGRWQCGAARRAAVPARQDGSGWA